MVRGGLSFRKLFFPLLLILHAFGILLGNWNGTVDAQVPALFEPGTNCRKSENPLESVICGVVRVATPQNVTFENVAATHPNPPAKGVSVYIYECDPTSPTCKFNGSLTNAYSSTSTDKNGYYYITMRKVGNLQIRYLVFACGGKIAALYKVPSYRSFTLNTPVNCPMENTYVKATNLLNPVSLTKLACDIIKPNPLVSWFTSVEGEYSPARKPGLEFNFWLEIDNADSRYLKRGSVFGGLIDSTFNPTSLAPDKGAFYYQDCERIYGSNPDVSRYCYKHNNTGEGVDDYENKLYNDPQFTVMNFLPNIPIKNNLLFFKDLTARQDVTNYAQNPTAPAQLLQTIFSNCKGKVFLRKYKGTATDTLPDCELLKKCNYAALPGETAGVAASNRQYTGGPSRGLANPAILELEAKATVASPEVASTEICTHNGSKITIGAIQPPWSFCELGTDGCPYTLDKTYWSPEFAYFFGYKGVSTKVGYSFEGSNDTFYGYGINQETWQYRQEKAGVPVKGGTYYTDNNYSLYRNNGLTSMMAGIAGTAMSNTGYELSYVLRRPGETEYERALYEQGVVKIEDAGSNILSFCENSNVNAHTASAEFTKTNETTLYINNNFGGNRDHYFSSIDLINDGKRTATSTIFLTTAANNRVQALADRSIKGTGLFDVYDTLLTASHGKGYYNFLDFLMALFGAAFGSDTSKSYADRKNAYPLAVGANGMGGDLRDDIKVHFPLSEENFESVFKMPAGNGHVVRGDWGEHPCYPWNHMDANQYCYQRWGTPKPGDEITRTCRVEYCGVYELKASCSCHYEGSSLIKDCDKSGEIIDACQPDDIFTDQGISTPFSQMCAQNKVDCITGLTPNEECIKNNYGLQDVSADCPSGDYWDVRWGGWEIIREGVDISGDYTFECHYGTCNTGTGTPRECRKRYSTGSTVPLPQYNVSCTLTESEASYAPACNMQDAGPYTCAGDIAKGATFRTSQGVLRGNVPTLPLDSTATINNEFWKKFANPNAVSKTYTTLAFQSANTSVSKEGTGGATANEISNKNKDIQGFGGASPEYKQISAHPLYANIYEGGMPIDKVCIGATCNLLPVPNPEIIDPTALDVSGSCQLNLDDACISKINSNFNLNFSPTFTTVLNAAAKRFNIDAATLLTYLAGIHKFEIGTYLYLFSRGGEQSLIEASYPWYGSVAGCDNTNVAAIGPFDHIKTWFDGALAQGAASALDELATGRGATASRCNFLDAAYVSAFKISSAGGQGCDASWDTVKNAILTEMFGATRTGAYSDAAIAGTINKLGSIYEECKN